MLTVLLQHSCGRILLRVIATLIKPHHETGVFLSIFVVIST
jgi:hypothetical protein